MATSHTSFEAIESQREPPVCTAWGLPYNHPLLAYEHIVELDIYLHEKLGWGAPRPPIPGTYGYDAYCASLWAMWCESRKGVTDEEQLSDAVHRGWVLAYTMWRDWEPWLNLERNYTKPKKPFGDSRREMCATTVYSELPDDEKDKDRVLVRAAVAKGYLRMVALPLEQR